MTNFYTKTKEVFKKRNINIYVLFFLFIYIVFIIKFVTFKQLDNNIFFGVYSLLVSFYILSRFALSYFYVPDDLNFDSNYEPTISFAVPSKNEGENIRETIIRIAQTDYPHQKIDIIAINDGSTDNTLSEMLRAKEIAKQEYNVDVIVVDWKVNKGKREGMAACVKMSDKDLVFFIDSDSFVEKNTAREVVKYFFEDSVGAVAGHAYVANPDVNFLTKMQSVRYFIAFKAYKSAESLFGTVTCCSGCCSAYRRKFVISFIDEWLEQSFLGVKCTYGDDRSMTNFLLKRGYKTVFSPTAIVHTFVPEKFRVFMRQQLRWKKSWVRESILAGLFIWKRHPIMSISFYMGIILPIIAPVVVFRALLWYPYVNSAIPWFYLFGLMLMAVIYGLYYFLYMRDYKWIYGVLFATFYTLVLIWQLPYAILNIRDSRWGTR
jgi:hyaluronan synthase